MVYNSGELRQEYWKFKTGLGYTENPYLEKKLWRHKPLSSRHSFGMHVGRLLKPLHTTKQTGSLLGEAPLRSAAHSGSGLSPLVLHSNRILTWKPLSQALLLRTQIQTDTEHLPLGMPGSPGAAHERALLTHDFPQLSSLVQKFHFF